MAKIICCLALIVVAEAGIHHNFPYLNSVYHGHGATSYQNVNIQNHLSVPIPKELQVDDGHEHIYAHKELEHMEYTPIDYEVSYRYHPDNYAHYDNPDYEYH